MLSLFQIQVPFRRLVRPALQLILLVIFLFFFGLPSIETYWKKEVIVVEKKSDSDGFPFPAITISVWMPEEERPYECYHLNHSIERCIEAKSLSNSDLLKGVWLGHVRRIPLNVTKDVLTEDSGHSRSGRFYTLNLPLTIGPDDDKDQVFLFLSNITLQYQLFIHDPKFFVYSDNLVGIPMEVRVFTIRSSVSHYQRINLIEMNELDVPSDPCNANPSYNFRSCVKKSVTRKVSFSLYKCQKPAKKYHPRWR